MEKQPTGGRRNPVADQIEKRYGDRPIRDLLLERLGSGRTVREVAAEWGVEQATVRRWAAREGIRERWVADGAAAASAQ
jgi:hypothetical protein